MAKGFKCGAGSGAGGLNFKVAPYASADLLPALASENTIAVITADPITSWIFSATEPENPTEGMVRINIGTSSSVAFNAAKKNAVMIYPLSVAQYIAGAWVERDAQIFQYGAWTELKKTLYIYNKGNSTGYSFACDTTMKQRSSGYPAVADRVTVGSTDITVTTNSRTYDFANIFVTDTSGSFVTVDLSEHTKVRIKGTLSGASKSDACVFRVLSEMGDECTANNVASKSFTAGTIDATIDISAVNSSCYLGFTFYDEVVTFILTELWLE